MKVPDLRHIWSSNATSLHLLLMQVLAAGTAFVVNILSASVMEPDGRGYLALLVQITYVLSVLALLGVERPYVASRQTSFGQAVYELIRLVAPGNVILAVMAVIAIVLVMREQYAAALSLSLVALYLVGNVGTRLIRTGYIASSRMPPFLIVSVGTQLILLALALALFLSKNANPDSWFIAYGCSGLVAIIAIGYAVSRQGRPTIRRSEERIIRRDGIKLLPASFGNTAMLRSDRLLLPLLASNAQLGIYIVVATTMELASWPVQNWVDASLKRWRGRDHTWASKARIILGVTAVTLIFAIGMGVVSLLVIRFTLDDSYAASEMLIAPLAFATIVYAATRVQQGLLIASGRHKSVSASEVVGMAASVLLYLILIPPLGALGAALASIGGYSACFIAALIFMNKKPARAIVAEEAPAR